MKCVTNLLTTINHTAPFELRALDARCSGRPILASALQKGVSFTFSSSCSLLLIIEISAGDAQPLFTLLDGADSMESDG
jgi:hypothetical protein